MPSGLATPIPAMSGAEPWIGSYRPGRPSPSEALGSIPSEPVITAASSERMSPNMFSVTMTSKEVGDRTRRMAHESTSWCSSCTSGYSRRTSTLTCRHRRDDSSTLALSTEVTRRGRGRGRDLEGQPRDPLDLGLRVDAGVEGARLVSPALAEVDAAGQLPDHQQSTPATRSWRAVDAISGMRRAPGAGWRRGRDPCAGRAGPARAASRSGRSSHFGPPTAPKSTASAARQRRACRRAAAPSSSIAVPPTGCSVISKLKSEPSPSGRAASLAAVTISGPIPSPGSATRSIVRLSAAAANFLPVRGVLLLRLLDLIDPIGQILDVSLQCRDVIGVLLLVVVEHADLLLELAEHLLAQRLDLFGVFLRLGLLGVDLLLESRQIGSQLGLLRGDVLGVGVALVVGLVSITSATTPMIAASTAAIAAKRVQKRTELEPILECQLLGGAGRLRGQLSSSGLCGRLPPGGGCCGAGCPGCEGWPWGCPDAGGG